MIAEFRDHPQAELARGLLENSGIRAAVWSDDCGGLAGGQTFVQGVRLFVPASDRETAMEILGRGSGRVGP
jgi:hypothetical protein